MNLQRKLAAILSADVKGYSRLMGDNEEATVRTITAYREVMGALIRDHRGRVVDSPGDNLMAEFASAVDAVQCATAIQSALALKNADLPDHRRMEFRIGINIGDVIVEGDAIYGDGVNIAARLESLADPGGICISGTVYDQVRRKIRLGYDFMGEQTVKNIVEPVRAYRVLWREEDLSKWAQNRGKIPRAHPSRKRVKSRWTKRVMVTVILMVFLMPLANHLKLNLLTKIWQCRLILLPNSMDVTVVTMEADEHTKMRMAQGEPQPPSFTEDPKLWRRYHARAIRNLHGMGAAAVGFDFWFSPPYDEATKEASQTFIQGLEWANEQKFPVVIGQFRNTQDPEVYRRASWGYISVYKDMTWIQEVMYLLSWDRLDISGSRVEHPSFFVEVLARKLGLNPKIEDGDVRLIGRPIPGRLWLAFSRTPFDTVGYHEVYNGTADRERLAGRIVLIGLCLTDTDYFRVPYSPTDFTPKIPGDGHGMPGVFLFANAINQVVNGYYHKEVNDEWSWPTASRWFSPVQLESLLFLILETLITCLVLAMVYSLLSRRKDWKWTYGAMGLAAVCLVMGLAAAPVLFGLINFLFAAIIFMIACARIKPVPEGGN
jgi:class 3 adenylate cyclase/CHASE2 domain-containing sensor protein